MSSFFNVLNLIFAQLEREGYRVALIDNVHSDIARCINDDICLSNSCFDGNKTSSQSSKLRWFETTTDRLAGVKCRATSVAKNTQKIR